MVRYRPDLAHASSSRCIQMCFAVMFEASWERVSTCRVCPSVVCKYLTGKGIKGLTHLRGGFSLLNWLPCLEATEHVCRSPRSVALNWKTSASGLGDNNDRSLWNVRESTRNNSQTLFREVHALENDGVLRRTTCWVKVRQRLHPAR
jgi:hypothetical protein